jgi:beta-glucosidase
MALPAGLALAATFSPELAYQSGALVGAEAHAKGFNVLLGGGMDLTRDPRNGRNFEYLGEDPLLAGILAAESVRGTQDQHVISTLEHFALNAHETNRTTLDAKIDRAAEECQQHPASPDQPEAHCRLGGKHALECCRVVARPR